MIPVAQPTIGEEEKAAVAEVLDSRWLATGERVAEFEAAVAALSGRAHGVAFMSGTDALDAAMRTHDALYRRLMVPSLTYCATANTIERAGHECVFVDIERASLMAADACHADVAFAGAIPDCASQIVDAAHAIGANGLKGDLIVYSFHPNKNITTGEGGMVVTSDEGFARELKRLRFHGLAVDGPYKGTVDYEPSGKSNMSDISAAIGLAQLKKLPELLRDRMYRVHQYKGELLDAGFGDERLTWPLGPWADGRVWNMFNVFIEWSEVGMCRPKFTKLMAERGVEVGWHYNPVHLHPYYWTKYHASLPETEWAGERIVTLPLFGHMTSAQVSEVCEAVQEVLA